MAKSDIENTQDSNAIGVVVQCPCSAWATPKQATPEEGEWVLHTYAGVRAPEYGMYARGRFWRNAGPESFPTTHWLRVPDIEPNAQAMASPPLTPQDTDHE
jgi:hypothetical protein